MLGAAIRPSEYVTSCADASLHISYLVVYQSDFRLIWPTAGPGDTGGWSEVGAPEATCLGGPTSALWSSFAGPPRRPGSWAVRAASSPCR